MRKVPGRTTTPSAGQPLPAQPVTEKVLEIIAGLRHVVTYDPLVRIADSLAIPRGWMVVAHDESCQPNVMAGGE
jgi:hypothetical protein